MRPLPGGLGNLDEFRTDFWPGFVGMTFRFHDPVARTWSIHWADSRGHALQPPVVGRFEGDTGIFEGDDTLDGRPVRVRFTWTRGESPRWEQAFSPDGGRTWETNWTMAMTRIRLPPPARLEAIELRRYRIVPGARDRFVRRFDAVVPEPFDQLGAPLLGQFRVRGDPDGFTWLRGFPTYEALAPVKASYYDGPHWARHSARTNALLAGTDDSLLLRPLEPLEAPPALDPEADPPPAGVAVTWLAPAPAGCAERLAAAADGAFRSFRAAGARALALLATLERPNPFPRHPVREDGPFVVWMGLVPDEGALARLRAAMDAATPALAAGGLLRGPVEVSVLEPTPRSRWR
ncbi:MAG: NIPSNAP family protein [Anaeromyxobacteraceae bacterium]